MGRRLVVLLIACLAVPVAAAATGDPKEAFTRADQAKAKAITLVRADLAAGWKKTSTPDSGDDLRCPGFDPNLSDLTLTGESESEFEHPGGAYAATFASVFRSEANARASFARFAKPALARCVAHFFREGVTKEGGTVRIVKQGQVAFPKVAPRVAAYRVTARVGAPGTTVTVPFTIDLILLGRGRGEVGLLTMSAGTGIAAAHLRAFARLLAARMQKAGV
ncbi:MAG TPA: hypothetical protein VM184_07555 [Gaiellaceae bacterium]|nr:hypothetical protein [Gaiellaceae bacterium]